MLFWDCKSCAKDEPADTKIQAARAPVKVLCEVRCLGFDMDRGKSGYSNGYHSIRWLGEIIVAQLLQPDNGIVMANWFRRDDRDDRTGWWLSDKVAPPKAGEQFDAARLIAQMKA